MEWHSKLKIDRRKSITRVTRAQIYRSKDQRSRSPGRLTPWRKSAVYSEWEGLQTANLVYGRYHRRTWRPSRSLRDIMQHSPASLTGAMTSKLKLLVAVHCSSQHLQGAGTNCSRRTTGLQCARSWELFALWTVVFIAQPLWFTALGTSCVHLSCSA